MHSRFFLFDKSSFKKRVTISQLHTFKKEEKTTVTWAVVPFHHDHNILPLGVNYAKYVPFERTLPSDSICTFFLTVHQIKRTQYYHDISK